MLGNSGSFLNLVFYQVPCLVSTQIGTYLYGLWFHWQFTLQSLCYYSFGLLDFSGAAGAPTGPLLVLADGRKSFPGHNAWCLHVGRQEPPSRWDKGYFPGGPTGRESVFPDCFHISGLLTYPPYWCSQLAWCCQQNSHSIMEGCTSWIAVYC